MKRFKHKFIKLIPENIESGILYISTYYNTVIHNCPCGCKNEVVTPISLSDWQIMYNGNSVSLYPSVGNWGLPCQSHYWINNNEIKWAPKWSKKRIKKNRERSTAGNKKILFNIFKS